MNFKKKRSFWDLLWAALIVLLVVGVPIWLLMIFLITESIPVFIAMIVYSSILWIIARRFE